MTNVWRRLSDHLAGNPEPEPLWGEGVPDHIEVPILNWLYEVRTFDMAGPVAVRLKLPSGILKSRDPYSELATLGDRMNPMLRLEVIDATLGCVQQAQRGAGWKNLQMVASHARQLEGILREGDPAFAVSADGSRPERRMDEALHAMYDKAVDAGASKSENAADHLRAAFTEVYGAQTRPECRVLTWRARRSSP